MAIDSNVLQEVVDALKQDPEIKNNVYQATVSRIDGEGVVWVNIAGSDTETPTAITSAEVAPGDSVNVEWRNNKLYIGGNYSNPSAGVVRVANVEQIADVAVANASRAQTAAANAEAYAQDAKETADAVHDIAVQASEDAGIAKTAAESAQGSADSALVGLSTVQDVVGVLNWITAHGTMTSQSGGTFDPDQVYFVMDDSTPGDYHVGSHYYSIVSEPKAADINSYYVLTVDESVQNYVATHIVVDSEGLWIIPDAGGNKVLIATGSGSTYTTAGTYIVGKVNGVDAVFAKFAADGERIGQSNDAHLDLDYHSMQFADKENNTFFYVSDLRTWQTIDGQDVLLANISESMVSTSETPIITVNPSFLPYSVGTTTAKVNGVDVQVAAVGNSYGVLYIRLQSTFNYGDLIEVTYKTASNLTKAYTVGKRKDSSNIGAYSIAGGYDATASGHYSHTEGSNTTASGNYSHAEGGFTTASGDTSHTEGSGTTASGSVSHAEGANTIASGNCSHAEGNFTTASGVYSHAEGDDTEASGGYSHAEGQYTTASDYYSHAQGHSTTASGVYSHAEGSSTTASGLASHAQNEGTKASKKAQTVVGTYNIEDTSATTTHPSGDTDYGQYAVIVGNGKSTRSNALTVDWSGNVEAAGDVTATGDIMAGGMAGMIQMFAGSTAPTGWLMCDGSAVSRTTYATLFSVIGTTYGTGDGSTTFNLPDFRGRVGVGVGNGTATGHTNHTLGQKNGNEDAIVPYHAHTMAHTHNTSTSGEYYITSSKTVANASFTVSTSGTNRWTVGYDASGNFHTRTATSGSSAANTGYAGTSGNVTGANMQPYLAINYIIATGKTA